MAKHIKYLNSHKDESKLHVLTAWAVVDLESKQGREIVRGALSQLKSSNQMRVGLILNTANPGYASKLTQAALDSQTSNTGLRNILGKKGICLHFRNWREI